MYQLLFQHLFLHFPCTVQSVGAADAVANWKVLTWCQMSSWYCNTSHHQHNLNCFDNLKFKMNNDTIKKCNVSHIYLQQSK